MADAVCYVKRQKLEVRLVTERLPPDMDFSQRLASTRKARGLTQDALAECRIFRRSIDARKRNDILLMYSVDIVVESEVAILAAIEREIS